MFQSRAIGRNLIVSAAAVVLLAGCDEAPTADARASMPPPPVTVSQPLQRDVVEWDEYTGRFEAVEYVEIRSRVSGYLDSIDFEDGEIVQKGDLLFVIDPRPFTIALEQAESELNQARTRLHFADKELERARPLVERRTISEQAFDQRLEAKRESEDAVKAAEAAVAAARLDLEFTRITAPVTGRISRNFVSIGNLISGGTADSTLLTTVVSLDPIHFYFDVSESDHLKYIRLSRRGDRPSSRQQANPVYLSLADEDDFVHLGHMNFVDNQIDFETGTVRGRVIYENPDKVFLPGMFARIRLLGSGEYIGLTLPDEAILSDQSRKFVYVVDDEGTVGYRQVELGPIVDGLRVVRSGITADDWVIVNGIQRARTGGKVTPQRSEIEIPGGTASAG